MAGAATGNQDAARRERTGPAPGGELRIGFAAIPGRIAFVKALLPEFACRPGHGTANLISSTGFMNISFDPALPVNQKRDEIRRAIEQHSTVIVCGETGSGKTTQIPKILLEMGRGKAGRIGHTQPRRIAARAVAARIADELKTELGALVGYKVRFHDEVGPKSVIKLMTDGILLAE